MQRKTIDTGALANFTVPEGDISNSPGLRFRPPWMKIHFVAACRTPKEFRNPAIFCDPFRVGCQSKRTLPQGSRERNPGLQNVTAAG